MSVVLTYAGLRVMQETVPVFSHPPFLRLIQTWHDKFHLQLINFPNILIGSVAVLAGSIIFAKSVRPAETAGDASAFRESARAPLDWKYVWPRLAGALTLFILLLIQLAYHSYSSVGLLLWVTSLTVFSLLLWKWERGNSVNLRLSVDWADGAWMSLLFALAIGFSAYLLDVIPTYLIPDEGSFWETANSIAHQVHNPAFFDFGVYSFPVASSIAQAVVMRFTDTSLWGWRFSSALVAALTVFPLYLLAKEWFNRRVAVIACLLLVTNPYFLSFARLGYNNSQALFPVTLTILFLVLGLRRGSRFYLWLAGLAAGFGFYTYFSAWLGLVVLVTALAALPLTDRIKFRNALSLVLIALAGWLAVSAPRIVYGMSSGLETSFYYKVAETSLVSGFYGRAIFGETAINEVTTWKVGGAEAFYHLPYYGIFLVRGIIRSLTALFVPGLYTDHFIVAELVGPGRSLFFVLGLALAMSRLRSARGLILNAWFWLGLLFLSVLGAFPPRPTHLVATLPVLALLTAFGLNAVVEVVIEQATFLPFTRRTWERVASLVLVLIFVSTGLSTYFTKMPLVYTPDFDRTASWLARSVSRSVTVVFIEDAPAPHDAAYQSKVGLTNHYVLSVPRADIPSLSGTIKAREFMAFVSADNEGGDALSSLAEVFPNASAQKITNPVGGTLGYVVSNIPTVSAWSIHLNEGLRDLWESPAQSILFVSLLATLFMAFMAWMRSGVAVGVESQRAAAAADGRSRQYESHTRWPVIDIDLRIRIQIPRRKEDPSPPVTDPNRGDEPS